MSTIPGSIDNTRAQTVTSAGNPVQSRISTVTAARSVYDRFVQTDNSGDARRRAILKGMADGNPPYNDAEMRERGLAHLTNVNFQSMGSNLDARVSSAHELFLEVPALIEVDPSVDYTNDPSVFDWCRIIADEFTHMFRNWPVFLANMDLIWRDSDMYGFGAALFDNPWSWQFKSVRRGQVLIDPSGSIDPSEHEVICIRDEVRPTDLFALTDDPEMSGQAGWKLDAVRKQLVETFSNATDAKAPGYNSSEWENLAQARLNCDPNYQARQFGVIQTVHMFVKEVSGARKVSHYIFTQQAGREDDFLYVKQDKYDSMSHVLWFFPYNFGYGSIGSIRGVASKMAQHEDLSNRILCSASDTVKLGGTLILRTANAVDYAKLKITQIGPYTLLPPEVQPVQTTFAPQVNDMLQMRGVADAVMRNNTGTYRQHSEAVENPGRMRTATEVMAETSHEARYEKNAIAMRYDHLDKLYREVMRRVSEARTLPKAVVFKGRELIEKFYARCESRGVDKKFLHGYGEDYTVSAFRSIGMGSLGVKFDLTNQLLNVSQLLPDEIGKRNAIFDFVAVRVGYRNAMKYVAPVNRDQIPSNEMSIAQLEWNDVSEGSQVRVGTDQWHPVHIAVFLEGIVGILQQVEQGRMQSYIQPAQTVNIALQHVSEHLQHLAANPKRANELRAIQAQLKQLEAPIQQLMALAEREQQLMEEQQQQQAQQQAELEQESQINAMRNQVLEEQAANGGPAALEKVKADYQLGLQKLQADNAIKTAIAQADIGRKNAMARADIANKNLTVQNDLALKRMQALQNPKLAGASEDIRVARENANRPGRP
jgi:Uncharacterized enzyme of heme biosynthesis